MAAIRELFRDNPIVALLGPRQVGKTTLARHFAAQARGRVDFYDLESPVDLRRLSMPQQVLAEPAAWTIIDEVQRRPELFEILRVLVDRPGAKTRFMILGSASPELVQGVTESLAGRVAFIDVPGLALPETGNDKLRQLWSRGAFRAPFWPPVTASARPGAKTLSGPFWSATSRRWASASHLKPCGASG